MSLQGSNIILKLIYNIIILFGNYDFSPLSPIKRVHIHVCLTDGVFHDEKSNGVFAS